MNIRKAAVAGMFYPASADQLESDIKLLLEKTEVKDKPEKIYGIIAPHAGYIYSGATAAYAYNMLKHRTYTTVIVISPSHREYFPGTCIYEGDAYSTPLGLLPVNKTVVDAMVKGRESIFKGVKGHRNEHALEVHLPFLQSVLEDFSIVPVVCGDQTKPFIDELAKSIASVWNNETLVVASTDLSHFYDHKTADFIDGVFEKHISNNTFDALMRDLDARKCEACGGGPVVAMLKAASIAGFNKTKVLNRTDSGEITGDLTEVVGYLSAVVYG